MSRRGSRSISVLGSGAGSPNPNLGTALPTPIQESNGQVFYVSTTGSDAAAGTLAAPWQTVNKAATTLTAGQRCFVRGGDYEQGTGSRLVWSANGTANAPISIEAYPGEPVVIHRNLRITGSFLRLRGVVVERNDLTLARAGNAFGWDATCAAAFPGEVGIWMDASSVHLDQVEIRNQRWSSILIGSGTNHQITRCWLHNNGSTHDDHGIYYSGGGTGSLVANCIIERNADFGIQFYPSPDGVILTNCTFVYGGSVLSQPPAFPYPTYTTVADGAYPYTNSSDGAGVIVNTLATNVVITNCIWVGHVTNGVRTLGTVTSSQVALFSNHLAFNHPNGGAGGNYDAQMTALGVNLSAGDPKFNVNGDSFTGATGGPGNYRIMTGSPAINAGLAAYTPQVDFAGNYRVTPDLGAFRYA